MEEYNYLDVPPTEKQVAYAKAIAKRLHIEHILDIFPYTKVEYSSFITVYSPRYHNIKYEARRL